MMHSVQNVQWLCAQLFHLKLNCQPLNCSSRINSNQGAACETSSHAKYENSITIHMCSKNTTTVEKSRLCMLTGNIL